MRSGAEPPAGAVVEHVEPLRGGPSMRVWLFWGLVFLAALITVFVILMNSSAGAAGDCGGG
ncbi:hypothetical protein [Nocardioides maradonensis]